MLKKISVSSLLPGMFVESVTKQKGSYKIANQGWVKSQAAIDKLVAAGIEEVEIDPDKTLHDEQQTENPTPADIEGEPAVFDPTKPQVSFNSEINKAQTLYNEAKQLQSKAFQDIKDGKRINVEPFKEVANGFIDSVFRNQDALACITRIREKDAYLLEHSVNVSVLMTIFAKHLGIERDIIHELASGALLHDIGKIKVPDHILNKPGKLTEAEFNEVKQHAKYSHEILLEAGLSEIAVEIAGFHHERLDGSGYPFALQGEQLSQYVRMISIVDVYDALTAKRVYKDGMNPINAFKILRNDCPHGFDLDLVNKFIKCVGVHPVGTLVKLKSEKLGIVAKSNFDAPLKPVVKVFYSAKHRHYTEVKDIDLASSKVNDELEASIKPEEFNIDLMKFFRNAFIT